MHNPYRPRLLITVFSFVIITSGVSKGAELEGALQYPPASVGQDAQPPPPAKMVPLPVSPRGTELGISGSSTPPSPQGFYTRPPLSSGEAKGQRQSGAGG
jgi:hypothetical protein